MSDNFIGINEEDLLEHLEKRNEFIKNLTLQDLFYRLEDSIKSTDIIIDGFNLVEKISETQGITIAGIMRLRETISETLDWISLNLLEEDSESDEL